MSSSHTLTFSRLRANFTVDKELIGKQDPYVIFQSGNAKAQTKAIKGVGTGTAEWKESYTLENFSPSSSSIVEVTVYNHNTLLPDSVIGSGTVDLSSQGQSSLSGSGEPISVQLTDKKGSNVGTLQFVTNGGGYTGTGSRSGTGVGSGTSTGTGIGSGTHGSHTGSHTGAGLGSAAGAGAAGAGAGAIAGKGIGTDKSTAQTASDRAAREGRQVTIEGQDGVGVGHPTGQTGSRTGTGSGIGSAVDSATGHHGHHGHHHGQHSGTGLTGTGTGVTGSRGVEGTTGTGVSSVTDRDASVYGVKEGDVIDRKYYVGTESRPQDQALVEQYREHNPYAKDYETTVQHTGRERLVNSQIEALGTRERVIGQDHQVHAHPHHEIARNLPATGANVEGVNIKAGATDVRPGGEGWVQTKPGPVCDTNQFSIAGDRTVDKERVTDLREHRDFEKEFEVKTRLVGERALDRGTDAPLAEQASGRGTDAEILNRERVLVDEKNKIACEGHPPASANNGATLASQGQGVGSGTSYGSGVGSGTGTGAGYGSGTGTGTGYGSGTGTGTGYGSGTGTGTGYGSGVGSTGQGRSTAGEKIAGYIPGTEEKADKRQGYQPGQGPDQNQGNVTAGEKAASFIPGTTENKEKKAGQYA